MTAVTAAGSDVRRTAIKKIHARAREMGLDEETRRDLQRRVTGFESCRDMSAAQLDAVLIELGAARPTPRATSLQAKKVRALWLSLYNLGAVRDDSERAIDAYVRRQTDVSALRFLGGRSAAPVIEPLKDWCRREGFDPPSDPVLARRLLLQAQWRRLTDLGQIKEETDGLLGWLRRHVAPRCADLGTLSAAHAHRATRMLGDRIRRVAPPVREEHDGRL